MGYGKALLIALDQLLNALCGGNHFKQGLALGTVRNAFLAAQAH